MAHRLGENIHGRPGRGQPSATSVRTSVFARIGVIAVAVAVAVAALASCAGLPEQGEDVSCILLIPIKIKKLHTTRALYGKYELRLEGVDRPIVVDPSRGHGIVTRLSPGRYRVLSQQFIYTTSSNRSPGTKGHVWNLKLPPFTLREGQITVLRHMLVVTMTQTGSSYSQGSDWRRVISSDQSEIRRQLENELGGWELVFDS